MSLPAALTFGQIEHSWETGIFICTPGSLPPNEWLVNSDQSSPAVSAENQNTLELVFMTALLRTHVSQLVLGFTLSRSFLLVSSE